MKLVFFFFAIVLAYVSAAPEPKADPKPWLYNTPLAYSPYAAIPYPSVYSYATPYAYPAPIVGYNGWNGWNGVGVVAI